jgi:hypothetical protein
VKGPFNIELNGTVKTFDAVKSNKQKHDHEFVVGCLSSIQGQDHSCLYAIGGDSKSGFERQIIQRSNQGVQGMLKELKNKVGAIIQNTTTGNLFLGTALKQATIQQNP